MDFSQSEEQAMLRTTARDYLQSECTEKVVRDIEEDDEGYSAELWQRIAGMGWLGLVYPEKYGGTGGNLLDLAVLYEEMGRAMFSSPHLSTAVICGLTILSAGSEAQKTDLLRKICEGSLILAAAIAEPDGCWNGQAWDCNGIAMPAVPEGDGFVISGTKLFVHDALVADKILCAARTRNTGRPEEGVTLFLIDAGTPGLACTPLKTTAGDRQCELIFNKVHVPKSQIVGSLNAGWPPLARSLQIGAVMLCSEMVGAGEAILDMTVNYAKTRVQFDQPIGVNQYVQEHCVYLLSEVVGSRWVTYQAAWKLSENLPADFEVAVAKAWTSDSHERACWYAHQVMAGTGYTLDAGMLPLYSRRAKMQQLYLGDTAYYLGKVADVVSRNPTPEKPHGSHLGLWDTPEEEKMPAWQPWQERWQAIQKRKEERRNGKGQARK